MNESRSLRRYLQTRRFSGRRGITPMRTKHRRSIVKTRSHKVEKPDVSIRKHTISRINRKWKEENTQEYCEDKKRKGDENSSHGGEWEDTEKCSQVEQNGNQEDSTESIHPGLIQTLPPMSEQKQTTADDETSDQTEIEAEELSPCL